MNLIKHAVCAAVSLGVISSGLSPVLADGNRMYCGFDTDILNAQIISDNNRADNAAQWTESEGGYTYNAGGAIELNAVGNGASVYMEADFAEPYTISDDYMVLELKFKSDVFLNKNISFDFRGETASGGIDYAGAVAVDNYDFINAVRNKTYKSMKGSEGKWNHLLLRFNKTYCEVYLNGVQYDTVAMRTIANKFTKFTGVRLGESVWSAQDEPLTVWFDEICAFECGEAELEAVGTIDDDLVLDFNNPIDAQSGSISVYREGEPVGADFSADPIDSTRIRFATDGANGIYTVEFEDIADKWGNTVSGSVDIVKTAVLNPSDAETDDDASWKDSSDSGVMMLHDFNSDSAISSVSSALTKATDVTHMNTMSARWATKSAANIQINFGTMGAREYDWTQYDYLNVWFYSENATGSTINAVVYSNGSASNYAYAQFDVDWEGWRLLSIPVSSISRTVNSPDMSKAFRLVFNSTGWGITNASDDCILYFERVWLSKDSPSEPAVFDSAYSPYGMDCMACKNAAVVLEFDKPLISADEVQIVDADNNVYSASAEISGKRIRVLCEQKLLPDTEYTVHVSGIWDINANKANAVSDVSFKTMPGGISASVPKFYDNASQRLADLPASGDVNAFSVVENNSEKARTAEITAVLYNADGSVCSIESERAELRPGENAKIFAALNSADYSGKFATAFVCDVTDGQKLAGAVYSALGMENAAPEGANKTVLSIDDLTIAGNIGRNEKRTVLVKMTDKSGEICLIRPITSDENGSWAVSYTFNPETALGGDYTIVASEHVQGRNYSESVYYASKSERDELLQTVNSAKSAQSIKDSVVKGASALEIDEKTASDRAAIENICTVLVEQKPYGSFADLVSMARKASDTLLELNECNWSVLTEFLAKNPIVIWASDSGYKTYEGIKETKSKQTINQNVMKYAPFADFESFRSRFSAEVKSYSDSANSAQSTGGGGGSSGGSRIGAVSAGASAPAATPAPEREGFIDMDNAAWAKNSVEFLREKSIVAMPEDRCFRPNDSITREEFVKLLVMALGVFDENAQADFADADVNAWYAPYIASAKAAGIAAGDENGCFGIGEAITRQDMAAMIYRASADRFEITAEIEFSDASEISEYAKEGVAALAKAGIINGVGEGRFAPADTATRAQAAVIIYGLLSK